MLLCACTHTAAAEIDIRGNLSLQLQGFTATAIHTGDHSTNTSVAGEIELYRELGSADRSILFTPFFRLDQHDDERSHIDVRELLFTQAADTWEIKAGIAQEFWGVAESRNVVDVINQFDQVESLTTTAKLGQPMINATLIRDWGNLGIYILPGFRERTLPGEDGRPRLPTPIDIDNAVYESDDEDQHIDVALRYSTYIEEWDIGLSYFNGTKRDPSFVFNNETQSLQPFYAQMSQIGIDVQATLESWLLKSELIHQSGDNFEDHMETVIGFEYSFYGVADSDLDIGVVAEHLWDERDEAPQPLQNDLLLGLRFALNDEDSSEALLGIISDLDGGGQTLSLEASRRIGNSFKLSAEALVWFNTDEGDALDAFAREDLLQLELGYFF